MKKIEKIKVRWHPRKLITYLTFIALAGLFIFWKFYIKFAKYTVKDVWQRSSIISVVVVVIIFLLIFIGILIKSKKAIYNINIENKTCTKREKKIQYKNIYYTQSLLQRMFGLVNIYLINEQEIMKIKDVSKKAIEYVDARQVKTCLFLLTLCIKDAIIAYVRIYYQIRQILNK